MASHRSWFPVILTGLSVALAVLIAAVYEPGSAPVQPSSTRPESEQVDISGAAPTEEQYQAAVNAVMDAHRQNRDVDASYNALVAIRVPVTYLDLHLQLVYLLNDMQQGLAVTDHVQTLIGQYDWLHSPLP